MSTLRAAVEIHDRSSSAFDRMLSRALRFQTSLEKIEQRLNKIEKRLEKAGLRRVEPKMGLNDTVFDRKMAADEARLAAMGAATVAPNVGGGGGTIPDIDAPGPAARAPGGVPDIIPGRTEGRLRAIFGMLGSLPFLIGSAFRAINSVFTALAEQGFKMVISGLTQMTEKMVQVGAIGATMGTRITSALGAVAGAGGPIGAVVGVVAALGVMAAGAMTAMGGLAMAILAVSAAAGALVVGLSALVPMVAAFVGGIAFGIAPIAMFAGQAMKLVEEKKKLVEQLEDLTPGTDAYASKLEQLDQVNKKILPGQEQLYDAFQEFKTILKDTVFTRQNRMLILDTLLEGLQAARKLLKIVAPMFTTFQTIINRVAEGFNAWVGSAQGTSEIAGFLAPLPRIFATFAPLLGEIARWFMFIARAAAPVAVFLLEEFAHWIGQTNDRLAKPGGVKDLSRTFVQFVPILRDVGIFIKDLANGFWEMGQVGIPIFRSLIEWLSEKGPGIRDWIIETAEVWGPRFIDLISRILEFAGEVGKIIAEIAAYFEPTFERIFGSGGTFDKALTILQEMKDGPLGWIAGLTLEVFVGALNTVLDVVNFILDKIIDLMQELQNIQDIATSLTDLNPFGNPFNDGPDAPADFDFTGVGDDAPVYGPPPPPTTPSTTGSPPSSSGPPASSTAPNAARIRRNQSYDGRSVTIGAVNINNGQDYESFMQRLKSDLDMGVANTGGDPSPYKAGTP